MPQGRAPHVDVATRSASPSSALSSSMRCSSRSVAVAVAGLRRAKASWARDVAATCRSPSHRLLHSPPSPSSSRLQFGDEECFSHQAKTIHKIPSAMFAVASMRVATLSLLLLLGNTTTKSKSDLHR
jgi:hypothetical protein